MSKTQNNKPIEIKISTVVAVSAILHTHDLATLDEAMKELTGSVPDYFDNELAVLDVGACDFSESAIDWPAMIGLFRSYSLNPVAVRGAPAGLETEILANGLSIDTLVKPRQEALAEDPSSVAPAVAAPAPAESVPAAPDPAARTMIIDTPVRAGQRIYARGADLVVMAVVNNGAELIADGCIHVYAPLRGRALAGASGNSEARIFAHSMEAELVSIAGIYRTFESGQPEELAKKPVQIRMVGDRIEVSSIRE